MQNNSPANQHLRPGLLCLILKGPRVGEQCTTIELKPAGFQFHETKTDSLNELISPCWTIHLRDGIFGIIEPEALLPIDPPAELIQTTIQENRNA